MASTLLMKVVMAMLPLLVMGTVTVMNPEIPREGDEFLLHCQGDGDMDSFLLHQEGQALVVGTHDELEIEVFQNASVFFQRITMKHDGTHLCLRKNQDGNIHGYTAPLRVRPLPPNDLWNDVYETKFVTGILAALVLAAMFAVGCLVYQYRWQPRPEKDQPILGASSGYDNPALSRADEKGADVESNSSTNF